MELHILENICIMFAAAVGVVIICHTLKNTFSSAATCSQEYCRAPTNFHASRCGGIERYAGIGVVLLLFSVGLEFSFAHLKQLQKRAGPIRPAHP